MLQKTNLNSNLKKEKNIFFPVHQFIHSYISIPIFARDDSGKLHTTKFTVQFVFVYSHVPRKLPHLQTFVHYSL